MTEGFRDYFVGDQGYDTLKKIMRSGNDFCQDAAKCLQERTDAEMAYSKFLRKNSDAFEKLAGRAKGTLAQAFKTLATQTLKESDAHSVLAGTILNDISIPMKNLADQQSKERKSIEDTLNGKFKEWNAQKDADNKYRTRQFEKSKEIETLTLKISEVSSTTKSSSKSKLDSSIKKVEEELEKVELKYHTSTRNVELLRQACDIEMCRSCDEMQKLEFNRINEMTNFIQTYSNSIQTLSETMYQITKDLHSIQIIPANDIILLARSSATSTELDILLYDIYAENEDNVMDSQRRILNLMRWMELLRRDIEIQQQTKNNIVRNSVHREDGSSSSSNDDDGSMYHAKKEKKKKDVSEGFSSEVFIDRHGAAILEELYKASLYKIEKTYNRIKRLPEPRYELTQRLTRTFNDKGYPITILRIPAQPSAQTYPSAPSATAQFAQVMPMYVPPPMQQQTFAYSTQRQAPPVSYAANDVMLQCSAPGPYQMYERMAPSAPVYPVLKSGVGPKHVRALYSYKATHKDELDLQPDDIIMLIERRKDGWCKGNLNNIIGLFPGNYVEDCL